MLKPFNKELIEKRLIIDNFIFPLELSLSILKKAKEDAFVEIENKGYINITNDFDLVRIALRKKDIVSEILLQEIISGKSIVEDNSDKSANLLEINEPCHLNLCYLLKLYHKVFNHHHISDDDYLITLDNKFIIDHRSNCNLNQCINPLDLLIRSWYHQNNNQLPTKLFWFPYEATCKEIHYLLEIEAVNTRIEFLESLLRFINKNGSNIESIKNQIKLLIFEKFEEILAQRRHIYPTIYDNYVPPTKKEQDHFPFVLKLDYWGKLDYYLNFEVYKR